MKTIIIYDSHKISKKDTLFLKEELKKSRFYKVIEFNYRGYEPNTKEFVAVGLLSKETGISKVHLTIELKKSYFETYFAKKIAKALGLKIEFKSY